MSEPLDFGLLLGDPEGRYSARSAAAPASSPERCSRKATPATASRATGIAAYLKNDDTLEKAAAMANYASTRTRSSTIAVMTRSASMKSSGS
jgi:hypothetical protein